MCIKYKKSRKHGMFTELEIVQGSWIVPQELGMLRDQLESRDKIMK